MQTDHAEVQPHPTNRTTSRRPLSATSRQATNLPARDRLTREDLERLTEEDDRNPFQFEAPTGLCFVQTGQNQQSCVKQVHFKGVSYPSRALKFFWETGTWPDLEEARPAFWKLSYEHRHLGAPTPLISPDLPFGLDLVYRLPLTMDAWHRPILKLRGLEVPVSENWVAIKKENPLSALIEVISIMRSLKKEHPSPYARFRSAVGLSKEQLPWWQYWATGNWARLNWEGDYSGASVYAPPLLADLAKIVESEERPALPKAWARAKSHKRKGSGTSLRARQKEDREIAARRSMEELERRNQESMRMHEEWKLRQIALEPAQDPAQPFPTAFPLLGSATKPPEPVQAPRQPLEALLWGDPSPWEPVP